MKDTPAKDGRQTADLDALSIEAGDALIEAAFPGRDQRLIRRMGRAWNRRGWPRFGLLRDALLRLMDEFPVIRRAGEWRIGDRVLLPTDEAAVVLALELRAEWHLHVWIPDTDTALAVAESELRRPAAV